MKRFKQALLMAGVAAALSVGSAQAQDAGEFRARQLERAKEQLEVTKDDEWKIISERVEKVYAAQRDVQALRAGGFGGGRGGGRGRGGNDGGNAGGGNNGGGGNRRGGGAAFFGEPPQELKDLQAAIEAKAPADEIKAKLEKLRAYRKTKEAALAKTQDGLKEVLNARQEATAVMMGLLQ